MSNIEYGNVSQQQEHQKERDSNSTIAPEGDCPEFQESLKILTRSFLDQRLSMFYGEQRSPDISSKLIQKAISWIQVTGYIKNLDF